MHRRPNGNARHEWPGLPALAGHRGGVGFGLEYPNPSGNSFPSGTPVVRLPNPLKPWFVHRPTQLARRIGREVFPASNPRQEVLLPWGALIEIDIREAIGRAIWNCGLYDLAVVEALMRLQDPELLAIDAGANIGAMTGALACCAAEVWAFEPHPVIHQRLLDNLQRLTGKPGFAPCRAFALALSDRDGEAQMENPDGFTANQGLARLAKEGGISVKTARLDELLAGRPVGVMKLDVEGHELGVLSGAEGSLREGLVQHVVFEDHVGPESPVCVFLQGLGFHLLAIGWRLSGPCVAPIDVGVPRNYDAPSYLATRDPDEVIRRFAPRGFRCFRSR